MRNILQLPHCNDAHKRMFLELFVEYLRQIFLTRTFQDCSARLREDWISRLFNRAKLFIIELGDQDQNQNQNLDIGQALANLLELCQSTLTELGLKMTLYCSSFNSITVNPLLTLGSEIRYHYYFTITIGRPVSPLFDEALNDVLISRLTRSRHTSSDPHLFSSFIGLSEDDS